MSAVILECPVSVKEALVASMGVSRRTSSLYDGIGTTGAQVYKVFVNAMDPDAPKKQVKSNQNSMTGTRERFFDPFRLKNLSLVSEHHSACVSTKVAAIFGLGFLLDSQDNTAVTTGTSPVDRLESEVDKILDPLCSVSWNDVYTSAGTDYVETGDGFIEVKRDNGNIVALYYLPSECVRIYIEDEDQNYHYEIVNAEDSTMPRFARFGDLDLFNARYNKGTNQLATSEVIHFRRPNNRDRWYGCPDWLAAVPCLELLQALHQFKHDFFLNRGVPEFMLFILGAKLSADDWKKVEDSIKGCIGTANSHKTIALNLANKDVQVQIEKLALENPGEDTFEKTKESLALSIVSAHRVPPLLAGIQIPGKLGAVNELPNALRAFQTLVVSQEQRTVFQILAATLGDPARNGGLPLTRENFKPYSVMDEIDLSMMDTSTRMRTPEATAAASGRDVSQGLRS